jgi:hypothetical protein
VTTTEDALIEPPTRDEAMKAIRAALKARSGRPWSVRGGVGTSRGWIRISAPPKRLLEGGGLNVDDTVDLRTLLGLGLAHVRVGHYKGENVPDTSDYYREYVDRAEGREPSVRGEPYWD